MRSRAPIGLSVNLTQSLQKSLYPRLCQYRESPQLASNRDFSAQIKVLGSLKPDLFQSLFPIESVRNVHMLQRESISHIFTPEGGRIYEPVPQGRMLVLTNQRVITFGQKAGNKETVLVPLEEVKVVAINAGQRSKGTLLQGGIMIGAAALFYVLIAYWLTGRFDGPQVPIIRMDLAALVIFLAVLTGVAILAQMYFAKPDGEVTFQGGEVKFTFPFKGQTSENEMHALVNAAFAARQKIVG